MAYDFEKERREAIDAGRRALNSLNAAKSDLDSARGWGLWDMLGGGMLSSYLKRSKMKSARDHMEQARYDLRSFSKELRDVDNYCDLGLNTDGFLSFADYFFDGFMVDFLVQNQINQARRQVDEAIRQTRRVLDELSRLRLQ